MLLHNIQLMQVSKLITWNNSPSRLPPCKTGNYLVCVYWYISVDVH